MSEVNVEVENNDPPEPGTWEALSEQGQGNVLLYDKFMRGMFSQLSGMMMRSNAAAMNAFATANVDDVIASLNDGVKIPNSTGLAGAQPLTKVEFQALQTILRSLAQTASDNVAMMTKAVGINAG